MGENRRTFSALTNFHAVDLTGLDRVKLMNRVDQKFILPESQLNAVLLEILPHYTVLEIDGKREFEYDSLYYDTGNLDLYRDHHNGKPNRVKVRKRDYVDTGNSFFEIKRKIKGYRTEKYRVSTEMSDKIGADEKLLLAKQDLMHLNLLPSLKIHYRRITLAGIHIPERITIDRALAFENSSFCEQLHGLVIIEVKQDEVKRESPIIQALRKRRNRPFGISKYALGVVLLRLSSKTNAFRHKVTKINQLIANYGA
jgi:hypothetical protein